MSDDLRSELGDDGGQAHQLSHQDRAGLSAHGERQIDGIAEAEGMEFEGGGETSTSC